MMISKKYTLWALNPLLLTMMAPAVAAFNKQMMKRSWCLPTAAIAP